MAFTPISNTVPQYEENGIAASGFYIKFYEAGTTTPTAMATDSTGGTLLDKCELNTEGYPKNGSNAVFIPHIDRRYKIALFRNATDADNNNLNNAVWPVDNMNPVLTEGSGEVETITDLRSVEPTQDGQQISLLGHTSAGIGGGEFYFDALDTASTDNNGTIIVTAGGKRWKRKDKGFITPEDFGALDSASDNYLALSSALSLGVPVVWNGDYITAKKIAVRTALNVNISGVGSLIESSSFVDSGDAGESEALLFIRPTSPVDVSVDGIRFLGRRSTSANWQNFRHSMDIVDARNVSVFNCLSDESSSIGFQVLSSESIKVKNNVITNPMYHSVFIKDSTDIIVSNNNIAGFGASAGIDTLIGGIGVLVGDSIDVNISCNIIDNMSDTGTKTEGCTNVIYESNTVTRSGKDGIKIQGTSSQTSDPLSAVISNNIIKDLYPTRSDGSTLLQISDTKHVTVTGNVISNDFSVTAASRIGIRTFNHSSGTVGQVGFVVVNGNEISNCADDASPLQSIQVIGNTGGGHTHTINNNMCYSSIVGGDGFGSCTINGNIVGAAESSSNSLALTGITSSAKSTTINGNIIRGFLIGATVSVTDPSDTEYSVAISGNTLENITNRQFDIGSQSAVVGNMSVVLSNNVCTNFIQTSEGAIRLRVAQVNMDAVSIIGNTLHGSYRFIVEFNGYSSGVIGSYSVYGNTEVSSLGTYFKSNFVNKCMRVLGDYAQSSTAPTSDKSYKRGDIVYNSVAASGLDVGFQLVNETTQSWLSIGTLP